jgi:hypothetical protein
VLRALKGACIEITAAIFSNVAIDRTETRNEQNFYAYARRVGNALLFRTPNLDSGTSDTSPPSQFADG